MKILQINSTLNWGSTGRIAEEIGNTIKANLGDSYIAYGRYHNKSSSKEIHIGSKWNIVTHVLQARFLDRHGLGSKNATKKFLNKVDGINPDIIHLHNIHGYYLNYELLFEYLSKANIPIIWTLHDCWAFTGHCAYYSFYGCEKWKTFCYECALKKTYPSSLLMDSSTKNFLDKKRLFTLPKKMILVPVSVWLAKEVAKSFLGKKYEIQVIHNGIDINVFSPTEVKTNTLNLDGKKIILGVANIWDERKGLKDFVKLRELLSDDYIIMLIGLSKKQCASLPKGIIGIERTNNIQELAGYYSIAEVFVNPTWEDNFPTTNLEALACGTPVITYRTGGSPEAVSCETGFVVKQGDFNAVISAINEIRMKGKPYYFQACRERAIQNFNKFDRYQEYIDLYKKVLNIK